MKHSFSPSILVVAVIALVTLGASCGNNTPTTESTYAPTKMNATAQTVGMNEPVTVGGITHSITFAETLETIPADRTMEQFKSIAKELPAQSGYTFIHLKGSVKNGTQETQSIDSNALKVVDADGLEYPFSTDVTLYIDNEKMPTFIEVPAGETKEWEAYYSVPTEQTNLTVKVTDLQLIPESLAYITLAF